MDHKFTQLIKQWLETPSDQRDYSVGALYLLKLSGNQIMYRNIIAQLDRRHDFVDYQIQKYYNFRVQALTHAQVEEMQQQVDVIVAEHISLAANADEHKTGKRDDHDSLPDEIKAKYVENLSIELDKKMHANWEEYDHYVIGTSEEERGTKKPQARTAQKKKSRSS